MPKETTLQLEIYFLAFIEEMVASGRFSSPSQVVQAGLRLLEESESHGRALRAAIQEGEESGWIENFDLDGFLAEMHKEAASKNVSDVASTAARDPVMVAARAMQRTAAARGLTEAELVKLLADKS